MAPRPTRAGRAPDVRELVRDASVSLPDGQTVTVASLEDVELGAYLTFAKTRSRPRRRTGPGHSGSIVSSLNENRAKSHSSDDTAETRYERGNETATLALQATEADAGTARPVSAHRVERLPRGGRARHESHPVPNQPVSR